VPPVASKNSSLEGEITATDYDLKERIADNEVVLWPFLIGISLLGLERDQRPIPPAFGPHIGLKASDFANVSTSKSTDKVVFTEYFYWYDAPSKLHVVDADDNSDALTDHPPTLDGFSFKNVAWHKRQLEDIIAAGIDVVLPVFWGAPSEQDPKAHLHWSYEGLLPLVQARDLLLKEGKRPPRIGLFYDTSTLENNRWGEHVDLTSKYGKQWFYATIRDFFSMIPPEHWALIDEKPVVFLYAAAFAKQYGQGFVEFLNQEFAKDFGGKVPYLVREVSWNIKSDNVYAWGGALGTKNPGVASVGPGYDHSAVPGREPLIVARENGKFYERNWLRFLRRPSNFVAIETWNEFHEGTEVCESKEHGRQYIDLTRKYVDLFKKGWKPAPLRGPYTGASEVSVLLAGKNTERGLKQIEHEDGRTAAVTKRGKPGRESLTNRFGSRFIYFTIDESFRPTQPTDYVLEIEYFDESPGEFSVEYDGSDPNAPFGGAYTKSPERVPLTGDCFWLRSSIELPQAVFAGSQNSGADFRVTLSGEKLTIGSVKLRRARKLLAPPAFFRDDPPRRLEQCRKLLFWRAPPIE